LVQENTSDLFRELFCLFDFCHLMFVILLLSLFHVTDDKLSLLPEDCQVLLKGPLEELFWELQELPGKNTLEKPQQLSADVSKTWGKMPPRPEEITSSGNVYLMGELITSEENWDTVEDVRPKKKQPKIRTRGEKIDFQMLSHKAYCSMVA
jgi:hypothetical protein